MLAFRACCWLGKERGAEGIALHLQTISLLALLVANLQAIVLHPFDLIATRMITEGSPQYETLKSSADHILKERGIAGLFLGVRASILSVVLPFSNWYLMGVPFLVKTRRMLDGMDTVYRSGMGGSLDLLRNLLAEEGLAGLFAGYKATLWGVLPAFAALCGTRIFVYLVFGNSTRIAQQRKRRRALLRHLLSSYKPEDEA
ncbi:unnamed protein product [Chrysoparadoxa australica]